MEENLVENDVSAPLQDQIFVVKNINQSTRSCNDNLPHNVTQHVMFTS